MNLLTFSNNIIIIIFDTKIIIFPQLSVGTLKSLLIYGPFRPWNGLPSFICCIIIFVNVASDDALTVTILSRHAGNDRDINEVNTRGEWSCTGEKR